MAMSRMNRVNLMTKGRSGGDNRGGNDNRYRDEGRYGERGGYDQNGRSDRMHDDRYEREFEHGERVEMRRGGWGNSDDMRRGPNGRYRDYGDQDDERYEGGGGRYAGNFRHREDSREHETDEKVKFDEHKAKEWVSRMKNNDGTTGEHFKAEQTDQLRNAHCPDCDKHEFWAAMNMMYSDYCDVAKKMNVDRPEFYAHMAKAFLMDKDAGEGKMAKYMKYIAGK